MPKYSIDLSVDVEAKDVEAAWAIAAEMHVTDEDAVEYPVLNVSEPFEIKD